MDKLIASYFIAGCFALVSQFVHLTRMIVQPACAYRLITLDDVDAWHPNISRRLSED